MQKNNDTLKWTLEVRPVADLLPADYNPRTLSKKQRQDLQESVSRFGQVEPLVINTDGRVIGGHSRITVYADLGIKETPVMLPSRKLSKAEERELNLRLNKNTGEWDWKKLNEFFSISDLTTVGFGDDEISVAFDKLSETHEDDFDADAEAEKIGKPKTQVGEVWALGDHRIICGDSTDPAVFAKLFGEERADCTFTDPPYNVDYNHRRKYSSMRKGRKGGFAGGDSVINDKLTDDKFASFLLGFFKNVYDFTKDSAAIYVCHATKSQREFFDTFRDAGFHFSQTIIWLKERIILALGQDYHRIYEPIMYGWKEGKPRWSNKKSPTEKEVWDLDRAEFEDRLDVWFLHRDKSKDYVHPTQKPVRLAERAMRRSCPVGGILFDGFLGSGSSLIAAEQLGRRCYGIELDPRYCDVIIKRWEKLTGKTAERI